MTNTKTVEQKENRSTVKNLDKMNSFYSNRQSGFVLKYRNYIAIMETITMAKNNFKMAAI
jgi:hypothetical protein